MESEIGQVGTAMAGTRWQTIVAQMRRPAQPRIMKWMTTARAMLAKRNAVPPYVGGLRQRVRDFHARPGITVADPCPRPTALEIVEPARREQPPLVLDLSLQQQLERFLRRRLPRIEIHTTAAANRMARRVGADAITAHNAIYFRHGAFQPHTPSGIALLAHEATHVAWPQAAMPAGGGPAADAQEERVALANERRYLAGRESVPLPSPAASPVAVEPLATATPAFVKTALAARAAEDDAPPQRIAAPELSDATLRVVKTELYRMLLDKLRSDFERGA